MWDLNELKQMRKDAQERKLEGEKVDKDLTLRNALEENKAKQAGEVTQKQMGIDAEKGVKAATVNVHNSEAGKANAEAKGTLLSNTLREKIMPSAVESGIAANTAGKFSSALDLARGKRTAITDNFAVDSRNNKVGLNDNEYQAHLDKQDAWNESAIAASKRKAGLAAGVKPKKKDGPITNPNFFPN